MITKANKIPSLKVIKTGLFVDKLSGIGGLPRGRIVEIFGTEGTGKSTLCFQIIGEAQRQGLRCLLVDVEHSFLPEYSEALGVDNKKLGIIRGRFAEDYIDETLDALESGDYDLVVFDSIGALSSKAFYEKESGEKVIAIQASLMSVFSREIAPIISENDICFIGVNHQRVDIMNNGKIFTPGGKLWQHHKKLSIRLKAKSDKFLEDEHKRIVGKKIIASVFKTGIGNTERMEIETKVIFGEGFSDAPDPLMDAIDAGVITKVGGNYFLREEKLCFGLPKLREKMKDETFNEKIKSALGF